jgi:hypothetical protein
MNYPAPHLFSAKDLQSQLDAQRRELSEKIHRLEPNQLTAENQPHVEAHFVEANLIRPLMLRPEDVVLEDPREVETRVQGRYESFTRKVLQFRFLVPFSGEAALFAFQPSQANFSPPAGTVEGNNLVLTFHREDRDPLAIKREFEGFIASVQQYIGWQGGMIASWNTSLPTLVHQQVQARREKTRRRSAISRRSRVPRGAKRRNTARRIGADPA